mgnify:FL=1
MKTICLKICNNVKFISKQYSIIIVRNCKNIGGIVMYTLINEILKELQYMASSYNEIKLTQSEKPFHRDVVPYVKKIDDLTEELSHYHDELIQFPYMNKEKLEILVKHIKELSVECHYNKTSKKLFNEKLKSVNYDLTNLFKYIKDKEESMH